MDKIKLFVYTVNEYKRFSKQTQKHAITDSYDESDYVQIQIKLMLLRKYNKNGENVNIGTIIEELIEKYPNDIKELEIILKDFKKIEKQQLEYVLSDGTKLNLYETIENVMYGLYLHADENKIERLLNTDESLRFVCVRHYVEEIEDIIFRVYDFLENHNETLLPTNKKEKAPIIYLGDKSKNTQSIEKSPYWSNLYGNDTTEEEKHEIIKSWNIEEMEILAKSLLFLNGLENNNDGLLDSLIFSTTKEDWGDYSNAKDFYKSINKIGLSTKVRYNDKHTMAYVRIFQNVDEPFTINSPHIIDELYEITFVIENNEWKIYSMGGHLDNYLLSD